MPCIGPIHFFLDGVCFLDAGLGLALGSGTTLLGTGEVEVGAHDVDETGGEAPNGPRTTAIRATLNPNTRRRTDRGGGTVGARGEEAIQGKARRYTVRGGWWARRVPRWVDTGWVTKVLRFLAETLSEL
jgi:hypothetical protein